jgi:hypothetical protein
MAAVENLDRRPAHDGLPDDRGHELLLGRLVAEAELDPRGDLGEVQGVEGGFAERAEHHRRGAHRGQPLALHVAEDEPHVGRGADHLVQVAADPGGGGGGDVPDGYIERRCLFRNRAQQDLLRDLGDRPDIGQLPLLALADGAGDHAGHGHAENGHERDDPSPGVEQVVVGGEKHAEDERYRADDRRLERAA